MENKALVSIIMGSDSDLPVMKKAAEVLEEFQIKYEMRILSAHRVPNHVKDYVTSLADKGVKVVIAGAGLAAHLPGVVASYTHLPVIGVPLKSGALNGLDSLLSIVQMPGGVPVATVAIDGAKNAGLLAVQILSTVDDTLAKKLIEYKKSMENEVLKKDAELNKL
ncbi:MAG: 5-(carboxyamino)imidazole ribonucleotide mutase [Melioribacteraceae bacterium]